MPPIAEGIQPQPSPAAVRWLRADDLDAILTIAAEAPEASQWSRKSYQTLFEQRGSLALGLEAAGGLIGFLVARQVSDQAEILNLAIKNDHRRQGRAAQLLSAALKEFLSCGVKSLYLEVRQSNTPAIAFYTKHGFERTGLRQDYYRDPPESAATMMRICTA